MKFLNFSLLNEPCAIEIHALDCIWDLHNVAGFDGFCQDVQTNRVEMKWHIDPVNVPLKYPAHGIGILFKGVEYFEVTSRDSDMPHSEDDCLAVVSRVLAGETFPRKPEDTEEREFHLLFEFQSGQKIRVGAEAAEFFTRPTTV